MRFAYADPPYIGQARAHYGPDAEEVNHDLLLAHLAEYDGWALSCSSPSLQELLPKCPPKTRVLAWVKGFASWKPGVHPTYAWEPVLLIPLRKRERLGMTVRDWFEGSMTDVRSGTLHGRKPRGFCYWLFNAAALRPDDDFADLFPGSGAVGKAWESWRSQQVLEPLAASGLVGKERTE
jgi:hypothetical protein